MIVLGIDPGTAATGFGVVSSEGSRLRALEHGVIETRAGVPMELRLADIHSRIGELLDAHRPDALAIEQLYFGANVRTAFAVGQARGVVLLAAGQRAIPSRSYTPQQVKSAVCGHGGAAKDQVGRMTATLLGLPGVPKPDHAADALAVAICDVNRAPLANAIGAADSPAPSTGSSRGMGIANSPPRSTGSSRGMGIANSPPRSTGSSRGMGIANSPPRSTGSSRGMGIRA